MKTPPKPKCRHPKKKILNDEFAPRRGRQKPFAWTCKKCGEFKIL